MTTSSASGACTDRFRRILTGIQAHPYFTGQPFVVRTLEAPHMELPSPPTDSLYKFIAIFGLVLILFSVSYPPAKGFDLKVAAADAVALSEKLDVGMDNVESKLSILERTKSPAKEDVAKVRELMTMTLLDRVDARRAKSLFMIQAEAAIFYLYLGISTLITGTILTVLGFSLWYVRIQRHLDKAIAKDGVRAS